MTNQDTQAAWRYHNGTKHPHGELMDRWHQFDPMSQPLLYKIYSDLQPVPLSLDSAPSGVPALSAISTSASTTVERSPDVGTLARVMYLTAGITKKIRYPWGEMPFRAAACTGALYHIELYVVCGELNGLGAGVYHFHPRELALRRLRDGDYRSTLVDASGGEPSLANAPAVIVYTDVFWRNAIKYQAREYRHAFWDSGTMLAHTLAVSSAHEVPAKLIAGFVDRDVNDLLDLDTDREVAVAMVSLGYAPDAASAPSPVAEPMGLKTVPISEHELDFPPIGEMHNASCLTSKEEVAAWRGEAPPMEMPTPSGQLFPLDRLVADDVSRDSIEAVIARRGSARQFAREPISFLQLSTIVSQATQGIEADFLESPGATASQIYLIVNAVDGLPPGAYVFHGDRQALELLREGDFRREAGYLGLDQALPADASVDVFFLSDLPSVLERFGNRGYRAAQLDASITAGRFYLAAYAQRLGATGLTFFDDAVTDFFSPHAEGKSVMFLVALGKRAQAALADGAEDQDRPGDGPGFVFDGGGAVVNRRRCSVPGNQGLSRNYPYQAAWTQVTHHPRREPS